MLIFNYCRAGSTDTNIGRLQQRVVDLLHFWLEGYYSIDFQYNQDLMQTLRNFIKDHVSTGNFDEGETGSRGKGTCRRQCEYQGVGG